MTRARLEILRYGATMALGLVVDLAMARAAVALGAPLELAAVLGVACGAAFNYVLLQFWAFSESKSAATVARPLRYLGALGFTMAIRSGAVWTFQAVLPPGTGAMVILCAAVGVSFAANFVVSKYWVFRPSSSPTSPSGE